MLLEEYRGNLIENTHSGRICIVDQSGQVLHSVGDANAFTYYRSVSKPFQIIPLFLRKIDKKFDLTCEEMTICAASHLGEDIHINILESILKKTGLTEEDLVMKPTCPGHADAREHFIRENLPLRKLYHNCSGKHLALMLLQRELTGAPKDYWRLESAAQQEILETIATISNFPVNQIICGIDGCGVPVFAVPLKCIANAFMKLTHPESFTNKNLESALRKVSECFSRYPFITRGHGHLCSQLNTLNNIIAKSGAEGVYGFGLKKEKLGIALKVSDGSAHTWPILIAEILRQIGYKDKLTFEILENLKSNIKFNDNGDRIGYYKPVFNLVP